MIDAHVHAFPDAAAGRAWQEVVGFVARLPGTVDDLRARMAAAGIERAILLLFPRSAQRLAALRAEAGEARPESALRAQVADELRALNRWGLGLAAGDPRFAPFVGVDPGFLSAREIEEEIAAGAAAGARGVKIIPPAMRRYPDDPELRPVFAACRELGLPLLSQSGAGGAAPPGPRGHYGRPAAFAPVLAAHPGLRIILAHLGRGYEDELVELAGRFPGVHADTSLALGDPRDRNAWRPGPVRALIERLGPERVLFGTNYPICDPVEYRARFDRLGLSPAAAAAVGRENALRLLGG